MELLIGTILSLSVHNKSLEMIRQGYQDDKWCGKLIDSTNDTMGVSHMGGLLYIGKRLFISRVPEIREALFHLAHDSLGQF